MNSVRVTKDNRYIPSIGEPNWNIEKLDKEQRKNIKSNIVAAITHDENEYRAVLAYLNRKFPDLMDDYVSSDGFGDGAKFQWRYNSFKDKVNAYDKVGKELFDMYGLVYYDASRDMEPIAVGGSYIREAGAIRDPETHQVIPGQVMNRHTSRIRCGHGYVLFVDPNYRRLGLAADQWITEAQLYRDSNIYYQKERQTLAALFVTLSMFKDKSKVHILSHNSLKDLKRIYETNPNSRVNTKIIMDYFDDELVESFENMQESLKDFRNPLDWRFLEREGITIEELIEPWYCKDEEKDNREKKIGQKSLSNATDSVEGQAVKESVISIRLSRKDFKDFKKNCNKINTTMSKELLNYINNFNRKMNEKE